MNITIPANKNRFPIVFAISFLLLISGSYYLLVHAEYIIYAIGFLIFLLYCCVISLIDYIRMIYQKKATFKISETGVNDSLSIFSVGEILWDDVSGIEISQALRTKFLIIHLHDNEKYLKGRHFLIRYMLKEFIKKWDSPVAISEKRIAYDLVQLKEILLRKENN